MTGTIEPLRWGVVGTGASSVRQIVADFALVPRAQR